jgi:hypothetical protein
LVIGFADGLRPYQDKIDRTVKALGSFSPSELELIATLHFIAQRQSQIGEKPCKESITAEFKSIKSSATGLAITRSTSGTVR